MSAKGVSQLPLLPPAFLPRKRTCVTCCPSLFGLLPNTPCIHTGGATKFDVLDIAVQPRKGKALLFFPAFSNGINDRWARMRRVRVCVG